MLSVLRRDAGLLCDSFEGAHETEEEPRQKKTFVKGTINLY